ncbi:MAG: DsbA family protein [Acidimicrobiales bacterium]
MDQVKFYFDPRCPWCYQTSRWAKQLERLGQIELDWGVFSLEVVNLEEGKDPLELVERGSPALRTAVAIADGHGSRAIGPFYTALGKRNFEQARPPEDAVTAVRDSLEEAGLDAALCDKALADPGTWQRVVDETVTIIDRIGRLGVPTIVLDGDGGPTMFGPVISELPTDDDAVELWRHTSWLVRYANFGELKRTRQPIDELPVLRWYAEQRAAKAREAAKS